jgi:hypothetical protein
MGATAGAAVQNIGEAVDKYNTWEEMRKTERARVALRSEILDKYGLKPDFIPEKTSIDDLERIAGRAMQLDDVITRAQKFGAVGVAEKKLAAQSLLADKAEFNSFIMATEKAVDEAAKEQKKAGEQSQAAGVLKNTSSMLSDRGFQGAPGLLPASPEIPTNKGEINLNYDPNQPETATNTPVTGTSAITLATPEGAVNPATLNPNRQEIPLSVYLKKQKGQEASSQDAEATLLQSPSIAEKAGEQSLKSYRGAFRDQDVINSELAAKKKAASGGSDDSIKDNQVVTNYNKAQKEKATMEKTIKQTNLDIEELRGNIEKLSQGKTIKFKGEFVPPTDPSIKNKIEAQLQILQGELEGYQSDLETYQAQYDEWGQEMKRRGIPGSGASKPPKEKPPIQDEVKTIQAATSAYAERAKKNGWPSWDSLSLPKRQEFTALYKKSIGQ